ncbi:amidohydrolase [Actinoplanes lobatus]|uniref:Amidohydrolase n=1 Tax=Actinoplanes lobatus TaxID=113568 RepID=A0A7W7MKE3_9ACTN|nr:amidohydrolase family protein [Actinoplanes lobatus]MBB4753286.1 imidazolonepropionase-like amidohydrolase [Actinoplanes lobatus]GGN59487.1 amidohydrolase [Actinoplanes lobatus]GIE37819.1 amidohydrolase [Actinoplanes lobatus]
MTRTLIRDVRVFDGERTVPRADILIDGARIMAPDGRPVDTVVDGSGRTLLPGLIDAHTHVVDGSLAAALAHGVTTELDMFCMPGNLARQRRLAAVRDDVADLRSAGMLATAPGGHPTQLLTDAGALGDAAGAIDAVTGPADAKRFAADRVAEGADYLKIVVDDGTLHGEGFPTLAPATVAALVEAAHAHGLRAIAHAVTAREVAIALDAGVDGLAHVPADLAAGPELSALAARIAAAGVFVVTTLVYFEAITAPAAAADHAKPSAAGHAARALHEAGVVLLAGTDANPYVPEHGIAMHRELLLLTGAGMPPEAALAAATSIPARVFGLTDRGRIAPGFRADLLLVDDDPISDISATKAIAAVWRGGVRLPA